MQVVHETFEVFVFNVYLRSQSYGRRRIPALAQWLADLAARKPHATLLVCGDFNSAQQPVRFLHNVSPPPTSMTFRRVILGRLVQSRTDWVMCSRPVEHETESRWTECSDHCALAIRLLLPVAGPKQNCIKFPTSIKALEICSRAEKRACCLQEFIESVTAAASRGEHTRKIRISLKQKKPQKNSLQALAAQIDRRLRSPLSKEAFKIINRLTILHPERRDGGIMSCYLSEADQVIVVG